MPHAPLRVTVVFERIEGYRELHLHPTVQDFGTLESHLLLLLDKIFPAFHSAGGSHVLHS